MTHRWSGIRLCVPAISLGLAACTALPTGTASANLRQEVMATERAFAKTMADRDHTAFASFIADEAVFFSGPTPLHGKAQVVASWARFYTNDKAPFSWDPDEVEVLESGTLAFSSGPVRNPDGKVIARFSSIWRRTSAHTWEIVFDKGNDVCNCTTQSPKLDAPNVVEISPQLVTSGQPTAATLEQLAAMGFGAVIYLAPPTVREAVKNEAEIVQRHGLMFINIPIPFNNPTEADFESFVAALSQVGSRKVLVHCQVNMRASSMVFLHRVVVGKESPQAAYEAVAKVWSPEGLWRDLIVAVLTKHQIAFEPY